MKQHRFVLLSIFFSILFSVIGAHDLFCQQTIEWNEDCVEEGGSGCGSWEPQTKKMLLEDPECYAMMHYKVRTCTSGAVVYKDYVITGWEILLGCEGWDTKTLYHEKYEGIKEYATIGLLKMDNEGLVDEIDCATDPPKTVANVYTASCGVWSCCEYQVQQPPAPVCDGYWSGPFPHFGVPAKVKSCKYVSCGETCCRKVYSMCKEFHTYEGVEYGAVKVTLLSKTRLKTCTGQLPSPAQPCEDGC